MSFLEEIQRRRTFGIISHPDAGKTTLTEKLLLLGGAIQEAGAVKNNKIKRYMNLANQDTKQNGTPAKNALFSHSVCNG